MLHEKVDLENRGSRYGPLFTRWVVSHVSLHTAHHIRLQHVVAHEKQNKQNKQTNKTCLLMSN